MTVLQASTTLPILLAAPPTTIRPALRSLGPRVRSHLPKLKMDTHLVPTEPPMLDLPSRVTSSSPTPPSSRDSSASAVPDTTAGADSFIIDAGIETKPPVEPSPLPAFLRQTRGRQ